MDETIAEFFYTLKNPAWRWVYGMLATYGLRPHEAFFVDLDELRKGAITITVLKGKTGQRQVWPFYPEWVDEFNLKQPLLPNVNLNRSHSAIGLSCGDHFSDKLPFNLYDLRHCWAVRTIEFDLDISLAAKQMGHSVQVHSEQYHHWINQNHHQRAFERILQRKDRPLPPNR